MGFAVSAALPTDCDHYAVGYGNIRTVVQCQIKQVQMALSHVLYLIKTCRWWQLLLNTAYVSELYPAYSSIFNYIYG
jgi:hypothetical protein